MKIKLIHMLILIFVFMSNCISTSSYQTARVLGTNEDGSNAGRMELNVGAINFGTESDFIAEAGFGYHFAAIPNKLELGIKVFSVGPGTLGISGDGKIAFLQTENTAIALGITGAYNSFSLEYGLGASTLETAMLFTFKLSPSVDITIAPRVTFVSYESDGSYVYEGSLAAFYMPGVILNLAIGKNNQVIPEIGVLFPMAYDSDVVGEPYYHFGLAFKFGRN